MAKNDLNFSRDGFGPTTVLSYTELQSMRHNGVASSDKYGVAYFSAMATITPIIRQTDNYGNVARLYGPDINNPFLIKTLLKIGYTNAMS